MSGIIGQKLLLRTGSKVVRERELYIHILKRLKL